MQMRKQVALGRVTLLRIPVDGKLDVFCVNAVVVLVGQKLRKLENNEEKYT